MSLWHNCLHKCRALMPQHTIKKEKKKVPSLCCIPHVDSAACKQGQSTCWLDKWMPICVTCHVSLFVMPNGEDITYLASLWQTVCVCTNRTGGCFLLRRDIDYSFNRMQQMLQLKCQLINFLVSCDQFPSRRFLKRIPRSIYINV